MTTKIIEFKDEVQSILKCKHEETKLNIGKYYVYLGSYLYLTGKCKKFNQVSLNGYIPDYVCWGDKTTIIYAELKDYGGVVKWWSEFITEVAKEIKKGKKYVGYCTGGHGRTGTFGASLVAKLSPKIEDPIEFVRTNYCEKAVETEAQAQAVFDILGREMPEKYKKPKTEHTGFGIKCQNCGTSYSYQTWFCNKCNISLYQPLDNDPHDVVLSYSRSAELDETTYVQCQNCGGWTTYNKEFCTTCNESWYELKGKIDI